MDHIGRIMEAERRNPGLTLKFGFNHRYHFGIQKAKQIVDSEKYGKILWVRAVYGKGESAVKGEDWRTNPDIAGGGILLDQGIHMLDLLRFFCGDFVEIKSMCATAYWDTPLEDNAFALLRDRLGRIAMLHSSFTQWKHRFTLEIFMSDGFVIVDGMPSGTRSYRDEWIIQARKGGGFAVGNPPEESTFCNTDPSWKMELAEFVDCIRNSRPVLNGNSTDAYEAMRMVHAIYNGDQVFQGQQAAKLRNAESGTGHHLASSEVADAAELSVDRHQRSASGSLDNLVYAAAVGHANTLRDVGAGAGSNCGDGEAKKAKR